MSAEFSDLTILEPLRVTLDPSDNSVTIQECNGDEMASLVTISAPTWQIIVREVARAKRDLAHRTAEGIERR
jgi:hypothetical protein